VSLIPLPLCRRAWPGATGLRAVDSVAVALAGHGPALSGRVSLIPLPLRRRAWPGATGLRVVDSVAVALAGHGPALPGCGLLIPLPLRSPGMARRYRVAGC